ncbi:uncharacterized protein LOC125655972 isoform X2 [Ostrea edulis]|nr:uncharacterized protein LOC125655972 isoform X2 [Ostrea edulis]
MLTNTNCSMEKQLAETMGTGNVIQVISNYILSDCIQSCINEAACLGMDYNQNNYTCRLYDSDRWTNNMYWSRQNGIQCDYFEKTEDCYNVIECRPPKDWKGSYYRGKLNVSFGGGCKNWKDTRFTYLTDHHNFCRNLNSNAPQISCVTFSGDVRDCDVPDCVNIQGEDTQVIFGETGTFFVNVTWHPLINVTYFEWKKDGAILNDPRYTVGSLPLPTLTIPNSTFSDRGNYKIRVRTHGYGTANDDFYLDVSGSDPITTLKINSSAVTLGISMGIVCELFDPPLPNIIYYRLERKRESDPTPEILVEMGTNETFSNVTVFIARFSTSTVTILDYSEYNCVTTNLISTQEYKHYLNIDAGESNLRGYVYIPTLHKVLKLMNSYLRTYENAELDCQRLNGTLFPITSLERQIFAEKMFREKWINAVGFVFISGQKFNNEWKINNSIAIFTYWDVSYPSNIASNRCIAQNLDPNYRWRDVSCDQKSHYLCELEPYCGEPNITFGTVEPGSTNLFSLRNYTCIGNKKTSTYLECLEDLQWHGNCEPVICTVPTGLNSNPVTNKTYYFNDTVYFVCNEGFTKESGMSSLVCGEDETWNGTPLNCKEILCEVVNVTNAQIVTMVTSTYLPMSSTIEYTCMPGFIKSAGIAISTCMSDGNWSTFLTCEAPVCPKEPINTTVYFVHHIDGFNTSDNMSLSCNKGYRYGSGKLNRTCHSDGKWSAPLPQCNRCTCPCDRVHPVQNLTTAELNKKIEELKQELVVNKRSLSSSVRKRTSAKDERPSATGVGIILGVGILIFVSALVIIPDIPKLTLDLRKNSLVEKVFKKYRER